MDRTRRTGSILEDLKINVKILLAALWSALMLIYIYVDIVSFYKPGALQGILSGRVWGFEISQEWAIGHAAGIVLLLWIIWIAARWPQEQP